MYKLLINNIENLQETIITACRAVRRATILWQQHVQTTVQKERAEYSIIVEGGIQFEYAAMLRQQFNNVFVC